MTEKKAKPGKKKGDARVSNPQKSATKTLSKAGAKTSSATAKVKLVKMVTRGLTPKSAQAKGHERATGAAASALIDQRIKDLGGWRGEALAHMRTLILEAVSEMTEEWKWMGTPVWSHDGNVCTGETYNKVVKLTFAQGAKVPDPSQLFNSSLEGNTRRAIDIHEGEKIDAVAFKTLVKAAVALNIQSAKKVTPSKKKRNL